MNIKRVLIFLTSLTVFTAYAVIAQQGPADHMPGSFGLFSPKVVAQLHLNSVQTKTLDNIQVERKAQFTQMRAQHEAMMKSMQTALKSDNPDMRALTKQMDANMDQMRDNMRKIQGEELSLYDTLSAQQKKTVRDALLKQMSSMHEHHEWKHGQNKPPKSNTDSGPGI